MTNQIQRINCEVIRRAAINSPGLPHALYEIDPELASVAYAIRDQLINPQDMPFLLGFKHCQTVERVAGLEAHVRTIESSDRYRAVECTQRGMSDRMQMYQNGETQRMGILQGGLTERNLVSETEQTKREAIKMRGLENVSKFQYEILANALRYQVDGQIRMSENMIRATHAEAEAYRNAEIAKEQIKADLARGLSQDRAREALGLAAIDFAKSIGAAEIQRGSLRNAARKEIVLSYLRAQTAFIREELNLQLQARVSLEKTRQQGIIFLQHAIDKGEKSVYLGLWEDGVGYCTGELAERIIASRNSCES